MRRSVSAVEDPRVVIERRCAIDDAKQAVAEFLAGVPEEPHPAFGLDDAVLDGDATLADVSPAVEILPVEQLSSASLLQAERQQQEYEGWSDDHGLASMPRLNDADGLIARARRSRTRRSAS
jgi:hypothetical protein